MTLPQFITNVTSYNDTVRILKNKGIITEADRYAPSNYQDDDDKELPAIYRMYNTDAYVDAMDAAGDMGDDDKEYEYIDDDDEDNEKDYDADYSEPNEPFGMAEAEEEDQMGDDEIEDILKQLEDKEDAEKVMGDKDDYNMSNKKGRKLNEAKSKWENTSGKAMYDQFKEIDNLNSYEVMLGINYEMEKNTELTKAAAAKIVIKNLKKNSNYYTASLTSGIEGYEIPSMSAKPEAWQMKELSKDNLVDKEMGMKPVKNIAKAKASANKAKKETNKAKDIDVLSLVAQTLRGVPKMQSQGEKMKTVKLRETIQRLVKEVMEEGENRYEYSGNSVDIGETGSSIEFNITKNEPEYYTVEYIIKPNSKYSSKSASRNNVRTTKTGTETIKKDKNARSEWITVRGDSFLIGKDFENKIFKEENK
jgi:hypothetical protein